MANRRSMGIGSLRHMQIDKDNSYIVIAVAVAAVCLVFALVAAQSLWKQASYNRRVISAKEDNLKVLETNKTNLDNLKTSYTQFVNQPTNIIGGSSTGTGDKDGDNAKIVLDSLPSVYDFPGLVSGFDKLLNTGEFGEVTISGTDDEVAQSTNKTPSMVDIALDITADGNTEETRAFLDRLYNSIRPFRINTLSFEGATSGDINISLSGTTYYQPKKNFEVKTEVIQ